MIRASLFALFALVVAAAVAPAEAGEKVCRTVSTTWQAGGQRLETRISQSAEAGCKRIWQSVDGVETEGVDCNCDLVIDGQEARFSPPPSPRQAARLLATCHGPVTTPEASPVRQSVAMPQPAPAPQTKTPRIIMQGASD